MRIWWFLQYLGSMRTNEENTASSEWKYTFQRNSKGKQEGKNARGRGVGALLLLLLLLLLLSLLLLLLLLLSLLLLLLLLLLPLLLLMMMMMMMMMMRTSWSPLLLMLTMLMNSSKCSKHSHVQDDGGLAISNRITLNKLTSTCMRVLLSVLGLLFAVWAWQLPWPLTRLDRNL